MNILAYGSLQNQASLEATLGRPVSYRTVRINGYEKVFNAPFGQYAYLNLKSNKSVGFLSAYFSIDQSELGKFDVREAGSLLIEAEPGYWAFVWPSKLCRDLPVLQSYIGICEAGASQLDIDLWQGTMKPFNVIDDRRDPQYH